MLAIRREPVTVSNVTHAPPGGLFVLHRMCSPIASRSHWEAAVIMLITSLPAAEPVSSDSATETSETPTPLKSFEQFGQVLHATGEAIMLADDDAVHLSFIHQGQQLFHAGPS